MTDLQIVTADDPGVLSLGSSLKRLSIMLIWIIEIMSLKMLL